MKALGFFGLKVIPGKAYSQIVERPFRITMASLSESSGKTKRVSLCVKSDKQEVVLCSLTSGKMEQQQLDITFIEDEEVTFSVKGDGEIDVTGNYLEDNWDDDYSSDEDEDSDEDNDEEEGSGESLGEDDEDDEDSDEEMDDEAILESLPEGIDREKVLKYLSGEIDSDDMDSSEGEEEEEDEEEDEEEEEEEDEEEEEEDEEEEEEEEANTKQPAKNGKKRAAESTDDQVESKKQKNTESGKKEKAKVTKLQNGMVIEELKVGTGRSVKGGDKIGMRYFGKLANGKVFDKNVSGKPFEFVLGKGEVIKGWDTGIAGMKLGGQRILKVPAALAYGKKGSPPQIPRNADLTFEVKLVKLK